MKVICVLLWVLSAATVAFADTAFTLDVSAPKTGLLKGEPLVLVVKVRNTGTEILWLPTELSDGSGGALYYLSKPVAEGESRSYELGVAGAVCGTSADRQLSPGAEAVVQQVMWLEGRVDDKRLRMDVVGEWRAKVKVASVYVIDAGNQKQYLDPHEAEVSATIADPTAPVDVDALQRLRAPSVLNALSGRLASVEVVNEIASLSNGGSSYAPYIATHWIQSVQSCMHVYGNENSMTKIEQVLSAADVSSNPLRAVVLLAVYRAYSSVRRDTDALQVKERLQTQFAANPVVVNLGAEW